MFNNFNILKTFLETGAIESAKNYLENTTNSEMFPITQDYQTSEERRQSYINEINIYLNL